VHLFIEELGDVDNLVVVASSPSFTCSKNCG
jgi:hypothetical protein